MMVFDGNPLTGMPLPERCTFEEVIIFGLILTLSTALTF